MRKKIVGSPVFGRLTAAGGIALISCIGQAAGLLAPIVVGKITTLTDNLSTGLYVVAVVVAGGLTAVFGLPARMVRERRDS